MRSLLLILFLATTTTLPSQSWQKNNLSNSNFIEDIGQCADFERKHKVDVKYMMYGNSSIFYIHNKGFSVFKNAFDEEVYGERMEELESSLGSDLTYEQLEQIELERGGDIYLETIEESVIHFWNDGFDVIVADRDDLLSNKFHFTPLKGDQLTNARVYQAITCKNTNTGTLVTFYPKDGGLKYDIEISTQEGLDRFAWNIDQASEVSLTKENEISVKKGVLNLIDMAPTAFITNGEAVAVDFELNDHKVSFKADNVPNWPLTIDPWVNDLDTFFAEVLNVETDEGSNIYVYLNTATYAEDEVRKYTANGTLIWSNIFNANSPTNGDLEIDHESSTIFVSAIGRVGKYDENGFNLWTTAFNEAWTLEFNCSENQFIGGGNWGVNGSKLHNLDPETGQPLSAFLLPNDQLATSDEVRSATSSPQGDYYFLSLNHLLKMCSGMKIDYQIPNGHTPLSYFGPSYGNLSFGQTIRGELNAIAVDSQYVYTYDGQHLIQRISASGVFVNDTVIPSGIVSMNGGIIVDNCGDIYLGTQTHVLKLDNSLSTIDSISVTTPVYDLAFNDSNQILITGVDNITSATFAHCFKQLCNPPDTFPYSLSSDTIVCVGDSVPLSASGGDSYRWFPEINITSTDSSHTVVYPDTTTTYGVLIQFDSCNYRIGYVTIAVDTITKYIVPDDTTICEGDSITLVLGGTPPSFQLSDTFGLYSEQGTEFTLSPSESTFYEIVGIGLDSSACVSSYNLNVLEKSFEQMLDTVLQCTGMPKEITYTPNDSVTWSSTESIAFNDTTATFLWDESGHVYITQKDYGVCTWIDSFYVWVPPIPVLFVEPYDSIICRGDQQVLRVYGAQNYTWSPDSIVEVLEVGFLLTPKDSLTMKITGEDSLGCIDSTWINFYTKPQAYTNIFLNDTVVCKDEPVTIHVEGTDSVYWSDYDNITQVGPNSYRYRANDDRELVLISAPNGFCPDSSRVNVYVHKISTINQLDTTICQGESVTFKPRVDGNYSLYPSFNVADNGDNEFVITPYSTTGYLLANDLGCVGNDSLFIRVIDCSYFIPNVVTPDGDGKNDQFFIQSDIILSAVGKIYNRWGNLMYENDLQKNPWDCTKGNSTVSDGTYFYSIDVITKDGESFKLRGEFTLFSE